MEKNAKIYVAGHRGMVGSAIIRALKQKAKELFLKENVRNLVLCPGNIERCLPGLWAANKLHLPLVSYLPLAFTQSETHANLGWLRDLFAGAIYKNVDSWIVNSPYQKRLLERFVKDDIEVLLNPLAWQISAPARKPRKRMNIAIAGRIFFEQKGQDILPEVAQLLFSSSVRISNVVSKKVSLPTSPVHTLPESALVSLKTIFSLSLSIGT